MIKHVYYENPITKETTFRKVGMVLNDNPIPDGNPDVNFPEYAVEIITVDTEGKFVEIEYSNGTTERSYQVLNILFDDHSKV